MGAMKNALIRWRDYAGVREGTDPLPGQLAAFVEYERDQLRAAAAATDTLNGCGAAAPSINPKCGGPKATKE